MYASECARQSETKHTKYLCIVCARVSFVTVRSKLTIFSMLSFTLYIYMHINMYTYMYYMYIVYINMHTYILYIYEYGFRQKLCTCMKIVSDKSYG